MLCILLTVFLGNVYSICDESPALELKPRFNSAVPIANATNGVFIYIWRSVQRILCLCIFRSAVRRYKAQASLSPGLPGRAD